MEQRVEVQFLQLRHPSEVVLLETREVNVRELEFRHGGEVGLGDLRGLLVELLFQRDAHGLRPVTEVVSASQANRTGKQEERDQKRSHDPTLSSEERYGSRTVSVTTPSGTRFPHP